jgi:class 3 adenylate cyclase/DNA-binding CsgD family transcriptional regulator/tetratricopeptide (TPR) repeat protein
MTQTAGVVALLFTDLVGSTEVLDRLGDDAAEELRQAHFLLLRQAVAETGGTEVKSLGDGLMVSFESPAQALECAVRMQRAIADHNRAQPGRMLQVRMGVHVGEPLRDEDDFHGTTVVVAKRLCDQASGGQILASDIVAALVGKRGNFGFRSAGRLKLKGLADLTPAVTVEWRESRWSSEPAPRSPPRIGRSLEGVVPSPTRPLIGRDQELDRAQAALAEAAAGHGQIVFFVGQMGMGKTRLAEEALALAHRQEFFALIGRTPPAGSGLAYAPLLSAFGAVLRSLDPKERENLVGDLPHLGRLWPELALPPPAPVQDADLERALLFEAVARLLERLAAESPVALFVDDLHWADAPSLALLGYLVPGLAALPVVLLGAYRPEGVAENKGLRQFVTNARRSGVVSELQIRGLEPDGVALMAAGILGDAPPASLLELSARAAGTPLFVEALVHGLLDAGTLVQSEGGWTLTEDRLAILPRSVQDLVVDRLDLLAPDERSTVELIAHGAQGLPHDVLEHAGGVDADQLLAVVRRLVEAGLVVQEEEGPEVVYRLSHPLTQEVAAAELPAVAGRRLHARLAQTVEQLRPRDLDRLAYHYSRAGREVDGDRALEVLLEAGERAHGLAAHDEAARHFGAALPLIRDGRRPELLAQVLERLGESWEPLGETSAAIEVWSEAVANLERVGDVRGVARLRRRLAFAAQATGDIAGAGRHLAAGIEALRELPPSDELVELHAARLLIDTPLGNPDRAREAVAELADLAQVLGSPRARTEALLAEVALMWLGGALPITSPRPKAEEALRIAEKAGEWLLARRAHRELAWLGLLLGDHRAMRHHALSQIDIDRRLGDTPHESGPLLQLSYAALLAGDFDEASRLAEEAVAHARRYDQRRSLAMCLGQLAMVQTHRGELEAAEEHLAEAHQVFPQLLTDPRGGRHLVGWPEAMLALERGNVATVHEAVAELNPASTRMLIGAAQVAGGDLEGALATLRVLDAAGPRGSYPAALADRLLGLIENARGETDAAREHLERSAAALTALDLPFEAAVSQLHAGTVDSVRQALATFETLGAARYADRARRAIRNLGVRVPSPRSGRGTDQRLSRRELEVAGLVAEGLSNAEIAQRLVLSVRTVESHLDHIYGRLGISSRAALAAWVTAGDQQAPAT